MPEIFDPYLKWLGIPPKHQPPNHYRLLGLESLEDDPDVIESAADRQMAHVRTFSTGKRMEQAEQLLKELAEARVALLNAEKKSAYDEKLKSSLSKKQQAKPRVNESPPKPPPPKAVGMAKAAAPKPKAAPAAPKPRAVMAAPAPKANGTGQTVSQPAGPMVVTERRSPTGRRQSGLPWVVLSVAGVGGLLLCVLAAIALPALFAPADAIVHDDQSTSAATTAPTTTSGEDATATPPSGTSHGDQAHETALPGDDTPPSQEEVDRAPDEDPPIDREEPADPDPNDGSESNIPPEEGDNLPPENPGDNAEPQVPENGSDIASEPTRPQPPAREKQVEIQKRIHELYLISTTAAPRDNARAARKLIDDAAQTPDNDDRFTMLRIAAELASEASDVPTASQAIDQIEKLYDIDTVAMRLDGVKRAAKIAPPEGKAEVIRGSLAVLDLLMQRNRYQEVEETAIALLGLARRLGDRDLNTALIERRQKAKSLGEMHEQAVAGVATLSKNPDDQAANKTVGSFWIFAKGNWEKGLPYLSKGDDASLAKLARLELDSPKKALDQADLGDGWFKRGKNEDQPAKDVMLRRAKHWYERSQDGVTGLTKAGVEQRLEEIEATLHPIDTTKPAVRVAQIFAACDSSFEMYLNGELLAKAGPFEGVQRADRELKAGDILTVMGSNRRGPQGFSAVIKFEQGDPIVTGQAGAWRAYTPANPALWYDPRGITSLANPVAADGDRHLQVEAQSGVASLSIWGANRFRSYFVLQIP